MSTQHTHNGKIYDIKKGDIDDHHEVRIFHDGKEIGPRYIVDKETANDYQDQHGRSLVDELVDTAKHDIDRGLCE